MILTHLGVCDEYQVLIIPSSEQLVSITIDYSLASRFLLSSLYELYFFTIDYFSKYLPSIERDHSLSDLEADDEKWMRSGSHQSLLTILVGIYHLVSSVYLTARLFAQ